MRPAPQHGLCYFQQTSQARRISINPYIVDWEAFGNVGAFLSEINDLLIS
jgi:hypothetical protein